MGNRIINQTFPESPITYTMKLSLPEKRVAYDLVFHSGCSIHSRFDGLDGLNYTINDKPYTDVQTLWKDVVEELTENTFIGTDQYGQRVLKTYESIPTFDSSDREWDSKKLHYLFYDGSQIHLAIMNGGYRIAKLTFYLKLLSADAEMKPLFEKLGWPMTGIQWK
ncbi:MAG: hypothetical protein IJD21_04160 [Oscillospiraceae bacterium]|nr:hypothetical protein [Oscillospiraceae bacterium]